MGIFWCSKMYHLTLSQTTNFRLFKTLRKTFSKSNENGEKFSERIENTTRGSRYFSQGGLNEN